MSAPLDAKAAAYVKLFEDLHSAHPQYASATDNVDALRINVEYVDLALRAMVVPTPKVFYRLDEPGIVATFMGSFPEKDRDVHPVIAEEYRIYPKSAKDGADAYSVVVQPSARTNTIARKSYPSRNLPTMNRAQVMEMLFGSLALQSLVIGMDVLYKEGNLRLACLGAHLLLNFNPMLVLDGKDRKEQFERTKKFAEQKVSSSLRLLQRRLANKIAVQLVYYAAKYETFLREPVAVAAAPAPAAAPATAPAATPVSAKRSAEPAVAAPPEQVLLPPVVLTTRDEPDREAAVVLSSLSQTPMSSLPRPVPMRYNQQPTEGGDEA
jgi:hypothetical protein